jgi:hypothetical protein
VTADCLVKLVVDPSGSVTERKEVIVTEEAHVMIEEEEDSAFGLGSWIVALVGPISACVYLKGFSLIAPASVAPCLASFWALGMTF